LDQGTDADCARLTIALCQKTDAQRQQAPVARRHPPRALRRRKIGGLTRRRERDIRIALRRSGTRWSSVHRRQCRCSFRTGRSLDTDRRTWGPMRTQSPPGTARTRPSRRASAHRSARLRRPCSRDNKSCPRRRSRRIDRPSRNSLHRGCRSRCRRRPRRPRLRRCCCRPPRRRSRRARSRCRPATVTRTTIGLESSRGRNNCNRGTSRTRRLGPDLQQAAGLPWDCRIPRVPVTRSTAAWPRGQLLPPELSKHRVCLARAVHQPGLQLDHRSSTSDSRTSTRPPTPTSASCSTTTARSPTSSATRSSLTCARPGASDGARVSVHDVSVGGRRRVPRV
jgi:hypothetical protein